MALETQMSNGMNELLDGEEAKELCQLDESPPLPMVPGPVKEQRAPQKRSVRVRNSIGVLVETLRIFEAVREAEMEEEEAVEVQEEYVEDNEEEQPTEEKIYRSCPEFPQQSLPLVNSPASSLQTQTVCEKIDCPESTDQTNVEKNSAEEDSESPEKCADPFRPVEMSVFEETEKCKRKRKNKKKSRVPLEVGGAHMHKYWAKRYQLFSKYDQGIILDQESWFSVTPEEIAKHIAERCRCDLIVDAFCGAGGNTIQFALTCQRVIAIDIDPEKIKMAANNARVYGVQDKVEFICADFLQVAPSLRADAIFLSPPWGGPDYLSKKVFNLEDLSCVNGKDLFKVAKGVSDNIVMYLPRNTNKKQLLSLAGPGKYVEMEQSVFKGKIVALTNYFGKLIDTGEDF